MDTVEFHCNSWQLVKDPDTFDGTVLVRRMIIPRWTSPILGSLPVLFILGTLLITSARYATVSLGFSGRLST